MVKLDHYVLNFEFRYKLDLMLIWERCRRMYLERNTTNISYAADIYRKWTLMKKVLNHQIS